MARKRTHCNKGHEFSDENTVVHEPSGERQCRTCKSTADALYRLSHTLEVAAYKRKYYENNKAQCVQRAKEWGEAHPDVMKKKNSDYKKKYPEKDRALQAKRRSRKTQAGGFYTQEEWLALCSKYDNRCLRCTRRRKLTADHVIPISKGGTSWITNIQPLCGTCNRRKGTKETDYRLSVKTQN